MSVTLAGFPLRSVQCIRTSQPRRLVQHTLPGLPGAVVQDLGRGPVDVVVEGLLVGDDLALLPELRAAHDTGAPLGLVADVLEGTEVVDVRVVHLAVQEVAGHPDRRQVRLALTEHVEPPQPPQEVIDAVQKSVVDEAAAWAEEVLTTLESDAAEDQTALDLFNLTLNALREDGSPVTTGTMWLTGKDNTELAAGIVDGKAVFADIPRQAYAIRWVKGPDEEGSV